MFDQVDRAPHCAHTTEVSRRVNPGNFVDLGVCARRSLRPSRVQMTTAGHACPALQL